MQALIDRIKQRKEGPMEVDIRVRNALVKVEKIEQGVRKTESGIFLPQGNMGMQFEIVRVLGVGPGVLLDNGDYKGCDDLKPGMYVLVKTGKKDPRGRGDIVGQEVRSCLDLDLGDQKFIIIHQNDILAILDNYTPPPPGEVAKAETKAEGKTETPKLVLVGDSGNQGTQHDAADDVN